MRSHRGYCRVGETKGFSTVPLHPHMRREPWEMLRMASLCTENTACPATVLRVEVAARVARSRMVHFWLSSATRDCARLSSLADRNWVLLIGGATYPESQCRTRKSRT